MSKQKKGNRPRRVDYWHDPAAPKPTSRKPSASVIVRNSAGDLLLLRRPDSGRWTIPTGGLKKNETLTQCAVRECREETGLDIEITALVGVFSDPAHVIAYADGEVRHHGHRDHLLQPARGLHPIAQDVGGVHQRWLGILATMPMFWTPAAFNASITFIRS